MCKNLQFLATLILIVCSLQIITALADDDLKVGVSAYIDTYYATDNDMINKPWDNNNTTELRKFTFVDPVKDQFALNIAQLSAAIDYKGFVRGKVTFQTGDLPLTAYIWGLPSLQEAFAGFKLTEGFWIDAGYYLTHIGAELYLPKDNWLTTHSIVTYFEPFYQAGIKATYQTGQVTAQLHVCNGNGILRDNNDNKSFGLFLAYTAGDIFTVSYANMIGNEEPGKPENAKLSMYHNLIVSSQPTQKLGLKAQLDYATKEKGKVATNEDGKLIGFAIQGRYNIFDPFNIAARFSWVDNTDGIGSGHVASGIDATLGLEYKPSSTSYIRLEGRRISLDDSDKSQGKIFKDSNGKPTGSRTEILLHFGIWID